MRVSALSFAAVFLSAILLSGCPGGGGGGGGDGGGNGDETPVPVGCPSDPFQNGFGCPDFTASQLYAEICASKGGNVSYSRDDSTCCFNEAKCVGDGGYIFPMQIGASTECISDSGCKPAGCSSQLCVPLYEDPVTDCMVRPEYACLNRTTCGCFDGACSWADTPEFLECMEALGSGSCPKFSPLSSEAVSACALAAGAPVALRDASGCFPKAICSTEISCDLFSYNCPEGFACNATLASPEGVCRKGQDFCGGAKNEACPRGSICEIIGSYPGATGVCRRLCDEGSPSACPNSTECVAGVCMKIQNRECSAAAQCPRPFACEGGICTLAEGRFCNSTTPQCPSGYRCDMSAGAGTTGSCEPFCGGSQGIACPAGEVCITKMKCEAGEICMDYEGICEPRSIPDSLAAYCGRQNGEHRATVIEFQKCANSSLFLMMREGKKEYAYVHADGRIERECGASGLKSDPVCATIRQECGALSAISKCPDLKKESYVLCALPFSASPSCPARTEVVCADLMVGMNPTLRSQEWRTFNNGCEACNANNPGQIAIGYWRAPC